MYLSSLMVLFDTIWKCNKDQTKSSVKERFEDQNKAPTEGKLFF